MLELLIDNSVQKSFYLCLSYEFGNSMNLQEKMVAQQVHSTDEKSHF